MSCGFFFIRALSNNIITPHRRAAYSYISLKTVLCNNIIIIIILYSARCVILILFSVYDRAAIVGIITRNTRRCGVIDVITYLHDLLQRGMVVIIFRKTMCDIIILRRGDWQKKKKNWTEECYTYYNILKALRLFMGYCKYIF